MKEKIQTHYGEEAKKHGTEGTSTIQDLRTRRLEIEALLLYMKDGMRMLEVGCGNGYVARTVITKLDVELDAIDLSPEMIALTKEQVFSDCRGSVKFAQQDILSLDTAYEYDLVFSERCLQNLVSFDEQKIAFSNITRALKLGGQFLMLESFWTGLNNLNECRSELDLPEIDPPWHNLFFDEEKTISYMEEIGCSYIDQNRFLSGYYFGSRVILPAITPNRKTVNSNSPLNDYFSFLPPHGDFCPMKILRFVKEV